MKENGRDPCCKYIHQKQNNKEDTLFFKRHNTSPLREVLVIPTWAPYITPGSGRGFFRQFLRLRKFNRFHRHRNSRRPILGWVSMISLQFVHVHELALRACRFLDFVQDGAYLLDYFVRPSVELGPFVFNSNFPSWVVIPHPLPDREGHGLNP